jgi:hypothetical protein
MSEIDWGLLGTNRPVDVAANVLVGYKMGSAIRDKQDSDSALSALAANPSDQRAISALYRTNPDVAAHLDKQLQERREEERRARLGTIAATDPHAAQAGALQEGDVDLAGEFGKMDDATRKRTADFWQMAAPIAFKLKQEPDPAKRRALWDQAKPMLATTGVDQAHLDAFDPTNDTQLDAAVATGQKVSDLIQQGKIEWHQQGENPSFATDAMGHPVGTQNPANGGIPKVSDKAGYDALPPGAHFYDPDGHLRTKGGQSAPSPTGGFP